MGFFKKPIFKKIFKKATEHVENELKVYLDGDRKVGNNPQMHSNSNEATSNHNGSTVHNQSPIPSDRVNIPQAIPVQTPSNFYNGSNSMSDLTLVPIRLPNNIVPGQITNVSVQGNVYPITIPQGAQPGQILQVRLPLKQQQANPNGSDAPFHTPWNSFHSHPVQKVSLGHTTAVVDPRKVASGSGRTKSLLIGINYPGTKAELRGCVNDVNRMRQFLIQQGYSDSPESMVVLADSPDGRVGSRTSDGLPTKSNIIKGLQWLVQGAREGDVLFFHYSGHGAQQKDPEGAEQDGMNETICPCDFQSAGMISDDELWSIAVWPLPSGVKLTALMDCCHSGTGLDLPFHFRFVKDSTNSTKQLKWKTEENPSHSLPDVSLFSGCADDETSLDSSSYSKEHRRRIASGAMTTAFLKAWEIFERNGTKPTYFQFLTQIHQCLDEAHPDSTGGAKPFPFISFGGGQRQQPQLSCSQSFDVYKRPMDLSPISSNSIMLNANLHKGRLVHHHFHPKIDLEGTGLGDMLIEMLSEFVKKHGAKMAKNLLQQLVK